MIPRSTNRWNRQTTKQAMFIFRGLLKTLSYLSARPSGKVPACHCVGMPTKVTRHTVENFPLPVHSVAMTAGRTGNARPYGPLFPNENADFLSDLLASNSIMLSRPPADSTEQAKISQHFWAFYHEHLARAGRQRDGLPCFPIQQLLYRCSGGPCWMFLSAALRHSLYRLFQYRAQRFAFVAIRPSNSDVHANVTCQYVGGENWPNFGKLYKDMSNQPAFLTLPYFASWAQFSSASQSIFQRPMRGRWHRGARWRLYPVRIACAFSFFYRSVAEQGHIRGTLSWISSNAFCRKEYIGDTPCSLLCLICYPPQSSSAFRAPLFRRALHEVSCAVPQSIKTIPVASISSFFGLARIRLYFQYICSNYSISFFRHGRLLGTFNLSRGLSQFGEWHDLFGQTLGSDMRGIQI